MDEMDEELFTQRMEQGEVLSRIAAAYAHLAYQFRRYSVERRVYHYVAAWLRDAATSKQRFEDWLGDAEASKQRFENRLRDAETGKQNFDNRVQSRLRFLRGHLQYWGLLGLSATEEDYRLLCVEIVLL